MAEPTQPSQSSHGDQMTDDALTEEFTRRCRFVLERSHEIHEESINLPRMANVVIGPITIFGSGENFENLRVSTLWPPHAAGPIPFLVVDTTGIQEEICLMPVLKEYIKILRQHMVLDDLAEI